MCLSLTGPVLTHRVNSAPPQPPTRAPWAPSNQRLYQAAVHTADLRPPLIVGVYKYVGATNFSLEVQLDEPGEVVGALTARGGNATLALPPGETVPMWPPVIEVGGGGRWAPGGKGGVGCVGGVLCGGWIGMGGVAWAWR